jgi:hypothetical protein
MRFAMKKRKLHLIAMPLVFACAAVGIFSFNWTQDNVSAGSFLLGFGELRDNIMSHSLCFNTAEVIKSAEKGVVVAVIKTPDSDSARFFSTLGNAVIVNHGDELVSVYGNLDHITLAGDSLEADSLIGVSGSSGWHREQAGLEFQIIDMKNQKALNPRTLMPRLESAASPALPVVVALNKQNESFLLGNARRIPAGQYKLYLRNGNAPYKTSVLVNGAVNETITYDALSASRENGRLTAQGKSPYTTEDIYPLTFGDARNYLYLSAVTLAQGRNTVAVIVADINSVERQAVFSVDVY